MGNMMSEFPSPGPKINLLQNEGRRENEINASKINVKNS